MARVTLAVGAEGVSFDAVAKVIGRVEFGVEDVERRIAVQLVFVRPVRMVDNARVREGQGLGGQRTIFVL